ncbi:ABC transporter substrate-binding protein [[Pseudomonas] carboxydohydrogena]|uniref:ABC transporter substrate-binding protein n=1 Tax=Afipia carboxydohydrogena TaxID=290 RepID=A0ABY8BS94_AFICR|nr:ABC transporter substrate-binding protein [[Pseudomonas] carboxydohydrogena]WEF52564.1 ABC transporter substrate-binding protein [[Pseudomonas] carboxydohydrogena]
MALSLRTIFCVALAALTLAAQPAAAAEPTLKVGLVLPLSGPLAGTGTQIDNALRLYLEQNGDTIEGTRIEVIVRDDEGNPDRTRDEVKGLIEEDKVDVLAGFGTSPAAAVAAPFATNAKIPMVVMGAQTSLVATRSPFIVRSGATLAQSAATLGKWAAKNGIRNAAALISDYAPGNDALREFSKAFVGDERIVNDEYRIPLTEADLRPPLMQIKGTKPDALFVFVAPWQAREVLEAIAAQGLAKDGIRLIATGDLTDDSMLKTLGPSALGIVTAHFYSAAHPSRANKQFVEAYRTAYGETPGAMAVSGYDGTRLICEALRATKGETNGEGLLKAMKGAEWKSPRGPFAIDPHSREVVQNIYMRKVEDVGGEKQNVEFATFENVRDPNNSGRER